MCNLISFNPHNVFDGGITVMLQMRKGAGEEGEGGRSESHS